MTDLGFTVYDYPVMRPVIALDGANGGIIKSDGANFAAFSGFNFIKIYDLTEIKYVLLLLQWFQGYTAQKI